MLGCKPTKTPMDHTTKVGVVKGIAPMHKGRYQRLVGKPIFLSQKTRHCLFS